MVFGVVHTPVKSRALPSIVFILRKMSALLQVDRAGDSESGFSGLRGSFLCRRNPEERTQLILKLRRKEVRVNVRLNLAT